MLVSLIECLVILVLMLALFNARALSISTTGITHLDGTHGAATICGDTCGSRRIAIRRLRRCRAIRYMRCAERQYCAAFAGNGSGMFRAALPGSAMVGRLIELFWAHSCASVNACWSCRTSRELVASQLLVPQCLEVRDWGWDAGPSAELNPPISGGLALHGLTYS